MTRQELNRDVKRLKQYYNTNKNNTILKIDADYVKKEFLRLYWADSNFQYMNKQNILFMLRFNLRHRFEPLHTFGIHITL